MGYSNGTYTRNHNFSADASIGIKILATRMDAEHDDIASALTNVVWTRDGNTTPNVDIPMGGHKFVGVGAAASIANYMRVREFIENIPLFMEDRESSADRVSVSSQFFTSVSTNQAPGDGTKIFVRANSNKSSAVLYLDGHSANIEYQDGTRIGPAMVGGGLYELIYSSADTAWKIQNPDDGRTAAEIAAGVTPTNLRFEPGDVRRYGADPTGVADSTSAIANALSINSTVTFPAGVYLANNLTQTHSFQNIVGLGTVRLEKNANGPLLTSSGDDALFRNIDFRDTNDAFTGKGLVCSGDRVRVEYCGGFRIEDTALEITGDAAQVIGTCNIWFTRTAAGYDISIGTSGTATLYHRLLNIYSSSSGGGIRFIDCGGQSVIGSQFGKLTIEEGTGPVGVNGGMYIGNRILGAVEVELSSSVFTGNQFGAINIHFVSGTSGHRLDESNVMGSGGTIDDDSNESYIVNTDLIPELQSFATVWTAASGGADIGDGTLAAFYTKQGRRVFYTMTLTFGSTTNPGTGNWTFTLPAAPAVKQIGVAQMEESGVNVEGGIVAFQHGLAAFQVFPTEAPSNAIGPTVPFTWGAGDTLVVSGEYYSD